MKITNEQRTEFLKSYNDLRNIIQTLWECQDLWMSDMRKLEELQDRMQNVLNFVPQEDKEGNRQPYMDWVFGDSSK